MKEICKAMITILLIILYGIGLAAADPVMTVSQQPTGTTIGDTFTVDVTVDPMGAEIYAAQYDLSFDASILNATAQTPGDFLSLGGAETLVFKNTFDNTIGKMTYCETRAGDPESGAAESGVLASITFEVIGDGISDLTLSNMAYEYPNEPEPEPDNHGSSGSSNFVAAPPAATAATSTATDNVVGSDSTPPAAEAEAISTTEPTATPTKAAAPSQPGSKTPGFEAASLVVVLLYLIKRRGE